MLGEPSCVPFRGGRGGGSDYVAMPVLLEAGLLEPQPVRVWRAYRRGFGIVSLQVSMVTD